MQLILGLRARGLLVVGALGAGLTGAGCAGPSGSGAERPPGPLPRKAIDVFIVAGQSNAVGFDAPAAELSADDVDAHALIWWRVGDPPPDEFDSTSGSKEWRTLQAQGRGEPMAKGSRPRQYGNFRHDSGGFGPEMGFALELAGAGDQPRAFLKVAFSGTSLAKDWDPLRVEESESCYRALLEEARLALDALRAAGWDPRISALLWVQGESDANEADAAAYPERMKRLIGGLRGALGSPDLAAVLAVNDQFGGRDNPLIARIVEAQRLVSMGDPAVVFTDASAASRANGAHFDAEGTLELGRAMAREWMALRAR